MTTTTPNAAQRLAARREQVLRRWEARVRKEIPGADREPHPILIDTLPAFLSKLAEALSPEHPRATATEGTTLAQEHGGERVRLTRFSLRDLMREYQLLRDALVEVLGEGTPLTAPELRVITVSIDNAACEACTAYALVTEGLRERIMMTLAHDLRSPLGAAKAGAGLILRRPQDPSVPRWAARVDENLDRVDELLRTLLDVSRAGSGTRLSFELASCDLVRVVRDVTERLKLAHGERFHIAAPEAMHGYWNGEALGRAVDNLLTNALKYGDRLRPITISIGQTHGRALVTVHNEGSYIPPPERETLFEAFRRTHEAERSHVRGWGLGLALVRAVVEAHGGSIAVESLPETGTTFIIDIPNDARPFQSAPVTPGAG
jgi:signal transduction histidine kinase